jgi:hypothetical protein
MPPLDRLEAAPVCLDEVDLPVGGELERERAELGAGRADRLAIGRLEMFSAITVGSDARTGKRETRRCFGDRRHSVTIPSRRLLSNKRVSAFL